MITNLNIVAIIGKEVNMSRNIAIITGANSGIGKEFTRIVSGYKDIDEIWAIARDKDRLNEIKHSFGDKIRIFSMDMTDRNNLSALKDMLKSERPNVKYLINCAGYATFGDYFTVPEERNFGMIDLNINALVALCTETINYMSAGARIINMASQAAFQPVPYQNVYSATKAFVRNYTRALNVELKNKGISATAVCPGWMNTRLIERAKIGADKATNKFDGMVEPYPVAFKAMKDANKNKDMSVYSAFIKFAHILSKLLPQRMLMKIWVLRQNID